MLVYSLLVFCFYDTHAIISNQVKKEDIITKSFSFKSMLLEYFFNFSFHIIDITSINKNMLVILYKVQKMSSKEIT